MQLTVLGGVGISDATSTFRPIVGQQGLTVALLVAAAPASVSVDEIAESLWPDRAPKTARNGLAVVISRLRQKLATIGIDIASEDDAYRLVADRSLVDLHQFEDEVAAARAAMASGHATEAQFALKHALGHWNGAAFHPHLHGERIVLAAAHADALRSEAEEMLVDALLTTGEFESAASLATELTALEPLRERRWELLMLALYRCGRQAEALRAFDDATDMLRQQLGVDPCPAVTDLHLAILHHAVPAAPGQAPTATGWANRIEVGRPARIPGPTTRFLGRDLELKRIEDAFGSSRLVTLVGPGGVGKTRLSREFAGLRPDAVEWIELAELDTESALATVGARFGVGAMDDDDEGTCRAIAEALAPWSGLIVFDNCEHVVDQVAMVAETIAQRCADVRLLCSSRLPMGTESEIAVDVAALDDSTAVDMLLDRACSTEDAPRLDEEVLLELVRRVDRLPLGIELVAGAIRNGLAEDIIRQLASSLAPLNAPRRSEVRHRDLASTIDWSLDLLEPETVEVFECMGVMAGPFAAAEADALVGRDVGQALSTLAEHSLLFTVNGSVGTRYGMLETMRVRAIERLRQRDALASTQLRHAEFFVSQARLVRPGTENGAGVRIRLADMLDQFRSAYRTARNTDRIDLMAELVRSIGRYLVWDRHHAEVGWIQEIIAHRDFATVPDRTDLLAFAALGAWFQGDFERADALIAQTRAEADREGVVHPGVLHNVEFRLAANRQDYDAAGAALMAWVVASAEQGDRVQTFESIVSMCTAAVFTGNYDDADAWASEAIRLARDAGDDGDLAVATWAVANAVYAREAAVGGTDLDQALRGFTEGSRLATSCGHLVVAGWCDDMIVGCLRRLGRTEEALALLGRIFRRWQSNPASAHLGMNQHLKELIMVLALVDRLADAERVARARRTLPFDGGLCPADASHFAEVEARFRDLDKPSIDDPVTTALDVLGR